MLIIHFKSCDDVLGSWQCSFVCFSKGWRTWASICKRWQCGRLGGLGSEVYTLQYRTLFHHKANCHVIRLACPIIHPVRSLMPNCMMMRFKGISLLWEPSTALFWVRYLIFRTCVQEKPDIYHKIQGTWCLLVADVQLCCSVTLLNCCRQRAAEGLMRVLDASKRHVMWERTSRAVGAPDANAELAISLQVNMCLIVPPLDKSRRAIEEVACWSLAQVVL
jgi:hypothetical protein